MMAHKTKVITTLIVLVLVLGLADLLRRGPATLPPRPPIATSPAKEYPALVKTGQERLELRAEAALIRRLNSGETLYEKNSEVRVPVASLTKIMTALLLAELGRPLDLIQFSSEVKKAGDEDDNRSPVAPGDRLKAEDIVKLLLVSSANDAAYAAAEYVGADGGDETESPFDKKVSRFVSRMNQRASDLKLANTHFANPSGRDHPDNFSSAKDITDLSAFIVAKYPELWSVSRIQETFIFGDQGRRYGLVNTNPLLGEFPAIYGSKTGFDDQAQGALVVVYELRPDDLVGIVILRSPDRFGDGRAAIRWMESNFRINFSRRAETKI